MIHDLLNPDFVLIGESDKKSGDILEEFYKKVCEKNPPVKRMSIVNAEITKISLNAYVTTKISFANMLTELCEKIPGGNVDAVTDAIGCDTRIGKKYLKGGLGYGGPCFPRDGRAIRNTAGKFGVSLPIVEATDKINQRQVPRLIEEIEAVLPEKGKLGILGLAYKPDTNVIEESQPVELARYFSEKAIEVVVYDPAAMEEAKKVLGNKIVYAKSLKECLSGTDVIALAVPWPEFKDINPDYFKKGGKKPVLIDCWRVLDAEKYREAADYIALGINYK